MTELRPARGWMVLLLEMALIVASILLAFSLESWRNGREALEQQRTTREMVLADFTRVQPQLKAYIEEGDSMLARKTRLVEALQDPTSAGVDSLQTLFAESGRPIVRIPVPPSYQMTLASGELESLGDPALMNALGILAFSDQMLAEHMRISADIFYTGLEAAVASRLGSSRVLSGGSQVPARFTTADYLTVVSSPDVYAAAERMVLVNRNMLSGLKQLDAAIGLVIDALAVDVGRGTS
jgi:hypothetical protein